MPVLYVLDVPEFRPVIDALVAQGLSEQRRDGYVRLSARGPIELERSAVGMSDATWFGFPVGGIEGEIVEHNEVRFRLV
jgi:hypothetical protein